MSLQLDERQRAMLAEMGVRVFLPAVEAAPPTSPLPQEMKAVEAPADPPAARRMPAAPAPVAGSAEGIAQAPTLPPLWGQGDARAQWLVIGDAQEDATGEPVEPFSGAAGKLLDNMLRALGVSRTRGAYLTCPPLGARATASGDVQQLLREQVERIQPRVILLMGRTSVQSLLQTTEPPGKLRGRVHDFYGVPAVVTYHPMHLLNKGEDKAKAWLDLCLAKSLLS